MSFYMVATVPEILRTIEKDTPHAHVHRGDCGYDRLFVLRHGLYDLASARH